MRIVFFIYRPLWVKFDEALRRLVTRLVRRVAGKVEDGGERRHRRDDGNEDDDVEKRQ